MLKVFIRLWLLIFIPLFYLIFATSYNPLHAINNYVLHERVTESYKGTFYLIEQELANYPRDQWPEIFDSIASEFGHELRLLTLDAEIDHSVPLRELEDGEYLIFSDAYDSDVIVKRIPDSHWFLYMMLEADEDQETLNQIQGTLNLLEKQFRKEDADQWQQKLNALQQHFGFQLSLIPQDALQLEDSKMAQFSELGRTWLTDDDDHSMIYLRLPSSESQSSTMVLQAGPVPLPGSELSVLAALVSVFVGGLSLGMLLFVMPLWRDLSRLKKSALNFGAGHLGERSNLSKRSVVKTLSTSFDTMADQIEKMIQSQRELTNAIAHDLRTPLSRLSFAFEMLKSEDITEQEKARYEQSIATGIDTLDHLIQQILALSRYSRASDITHFESCQFARVLHQEIAPLQLEYARLRIELNIDPALSDQTLFIDRRAMLRALNNLLSNAIRYARSSVRIGLSQNEENIMLVVEDDGCGVPESEREKVFLPFKQLDNEQREISREHGLGLAIVKEIARWHRGSVRLDESPLGGARFEIRWPKSP